MNLTKLLFGMLFVVMSNNSMYCQNTITTSGGESMGSGTVSFTIGQIVYSQLSNTNNISIIQGVQQPFEISTVLNSPKFNDISLTYLIYPNPTTDFLVLNIENVNQHHLKYALYDLNGKLLSSKKLVDKNSEIQMKYLKTATYFLKISDNNQRIIKTFKILKH